MGPRSDRSQSGPTDDPYNSFLFESNHKSEAECDSRKCRGYGKPGNTGEQVFQNFVFGNSSIFLVMNGHFTGEFTQVSYNRVGQPVVEMVADYQGLQNGGDGWLRIIDFNFPLNRLEFSTYSPTRNEFQTDANSPFHHSV